MPEVPKLIQCGDHQWAPWCIVCVHLIDGTSHQWERIVGEDGNQNDWVCPECIAKGLNDVPLDNLKACCMH